jgi:hypothetical protein
MRIYLWKKQTLTSKSFIKINIIVVIILTLSLPLLTFKLSRIQVKTKQLRYELGLLQRQQQSQVVKQQQAKDYQQFANNLQYFYASAMQQGLEEKLWNKHEVSIIGREVNYDELKKIIEESQSDLNQYFVPKKLILQQNIKKGARKSEEIILTLFGTYLIHKQKYAK